VNAPPWRRSSHCLLPADAPAAPASFARRIAALLYEALLLVAMAIIVGFAFLPIISPAAPGQSLRIPSVFGRMLLFCVLAGGAGVYYTWCWSDGRRTLPQKTWGLLIVRGDGSPVTRGAALLRYIAAWMGPTLALLAYVAMAPDRRRYAAVLLAFNYAWVLVDRDRQFLHDRLAGTRVVRQM